MINLLKKKRLSLCLIIFSSILYIPVCLANEQNCVILLHGLGRTHHSMSSLGSVFKALLGPAGQALSTSEQVHMLPTKRTYKVSVIAGDAHDLLFSRYFFHEPNDGKVAVSSAYMPGSDEFIIRPVTHTFMMNHALVQEHIFNFLAL